MTPAADHLAEAFTQDQTQPREGPPLFPGHPVTDQPDFIDLHVGLQMRSRRLALRQSQGALAKALGVSFQQIQKYERGSNRVSASMLYKAATFQGVRPGYYFDGLAQILEPEVDEEIARVRSWLDSGQGWALGEACSELSPSANAALLDLAQQMKTAA